MYALGPRAAASGLGSLRVTSAGRGEAEARWAGAEAAVTDSELGPCAPPPGQHPVVPTRQRAACLLVVPRGRSSEASREPTVQCNGRR